MPEQLPDHTHCLVCDAAVPVEQRFCSERCENEFKEASKKSRRRNNLFFIAMIAVTIIVTVVSLLL